MLLLGAKPLYKLTGTDRQAGRQADGRTDKPRHWEACIFKNLSLVVVTTRKNLSLDIKIETECKYFQPMPDR